MLHYSRPARSKAKLKALIGIVVIPELSKGIVTRKSGGDHEKTGLSI